MFPENYDIQEYYLSAQGTFVFDTLRKRIKHIWPIDEQNSLVMAGFGFTFPYLDLYAECPENKNQQTPEQEENAWKAPDIFALVSRRSGLYNWPQGQDNRTVLCRRGEWPFPKESIDRILVIHDGEYASSLDAMLAEIWRVLKPNGRLLMVLPNRTGLWVRRDQNPFGQGASYSIPQVRKVLRESHFVYEGACGALVTPPFQSKFLLRTFGALLEPLGRFCTTASGVQLVEASKRLYAPTGKKQPLAQNLRKMIWPSPQSTKPIASSHKNGATK
jgi:SAM-dependent methyltransferase